MTENKKLRNIVAVPIAILILLIGAIAYAIDQMCDQIYDALANWVHGNKGDLDEQ